MLCVLNPARSLAADVSLTLDLREASHIETRALELLGYLPGPSSTSATAIYSEVCCVLGGVGVVVLLLLKLFPVCRADEGTPVTGADALGATAPVQGLNCFFGLYLLLPG